jgi:hypothetical protein
MPTHFRQAIATLAIAAAGSALTAGTAAAQTYITTDPVETRTVVREPLALTPAQRTTIYRTIVPQGRGKQPIVREREVRETTGSAVRDRVLVDPAIPDRVVVDQAPTRIVVDQWGNRVVVDQWGNRVVGDPPVSNRVVIDQWGRERIVAAPTEVNYVVGDRVPAGVQLAAFPDRVVRTVPAIGGYRYMVVNDRVLLVDPASNTIVQEIVR